MNKQEENRDAPRSPLGLLGIASTMGLHMVSGPIVGGGLGYLADSWLETWPWGAGIGVILGILAGFRNVYVDSREIIQTHEDMNASERKRDEDTR